MKPILRKFWQSSPHRERICFNALAESHENEWRTVPRRNSKPPVATLMEALGLRQRAQYSRRFAAIRGELCRLGFEAV